MQPHALVMMETAVAFNQQRQRESQAPLKQQLRVSKGAPWDKNDDVALSVQSSHHRGRVFPA